MGQSATACFFGNPSPLAGRTLVFQRVHRKIACRDGSDKLSSSWQGGKRIVRSDESPVFGANAERGVHLLPIAATANTTKCRVRNGRLVSEPFWALAACREAVIVFRCQRANDVQGWMPLVLLRGRRTNRVSLAAFVSAAGAAPRPPAFCFRPGHGRLPVQSGCAARGRAVVGRGERTRQRGWR